MARQHRIVTDHVAPAFHALLKEVGRAANVTKSLATAVGNDTPAFWKSSLARKVQLILTKVAAEPRVLQPSAEVSWYAGETSYESGEKWCSGLLFLFGAGHFGRFAETLISASTTVLSPRRKAELVAAIRTSCAAAEPMTARQYGAQIQKSGISDTSARIAIQNFVKNGCREDRSDRNTGTLSFAERAALRDAFANSGPLLDPSCAVVQSTCTFAELADGGIQLQRNIAATALWHYFSSAGPSW